MIEIHRILCPTDFSEFSRHALDHAVALAKCYDAAVDVLYVHVVPAMVPNVPEILPATVLTREQRHAVAQGQRVTDTTPGNFPHCT